MQGKDTGTRDDMQLVNDIAKEIGVDLGGIEVSAKRLGKINSNGYQLLCVKMNLEKREEMLEKAKNLAGVQGYEGVFIQPDLSKTERNGFKLREERRKMQIENPGKSFIIRRGNVIEKSGVSKNGD